METIFSLSNILVLPFWALMIFAPHWRWTKRLIGSPLIAVPTALLYAALVLPQVVAVLPAVMNPTLSGIAGLLGTPEGATIAWAHFLTFDLLAGRWAYLDSREQGITAWLVSPILFFVLMLGPVGFLLYLITRSLYPRVTQKPVSHPA